MQRHLLALSLLSLAACGEPSGDAWSPDGGAPRPREGQQPVDGGGGPVRRVLGPVTVTQSCGNHACLECNGRVVEANNRCNECYALCVYSSNPSCLSSCPSICAGARPPDCTYQCSETSCADEDVAFEITGPRSEPLYTACVDAFRRNATCDPTAQLAPEAVCDRIARTHAPEMIAHYQCAAAQTCTADVNEVCPVPSANELLAWYCAELPRFGARCSGNKLERALDWIDPRVSTDVLNAVRFCEEEDVSLFDFQTCVRDWALAAGYRTE